MPIRRWIAVYIIIIVVTLSVSGCLGTKTAVTPAPVPPALLLDYHRTGGIAGVDDHLILFNNGAGLISTRVITREFQMNSSEIDRLDRIFRQAEFDTLQGNYTSASGGADFMTYSIEYGNKSVIAEDTVIPFTLQPVIRELNSIISSRSYQDPVMGSLANIRT